MPCAGTRPGRARDPLQHRPRRRHPDRAHALAVEEPDQLVRRHPLRDEAVHARRAIVQPGLLVAVEGRGEREVDHEARREQRDRDDGHDNRGHPPAQRAHRDDAADAADGRGAHVPSPAGRSV